MENIRLGIYFVSLMIVFSSFSAFAPINDSTCSPPFKKMNVGMLNTVNRLATGLHALTLTYCEFLI